MSLQSFAGQYDSNDGESEGPYNFDCEWHISLDGYWSDIDPFYFGEHTPNQPPLMAVPEKLAADIDILQDETMIRALSEWLYSDDPGVYSEVIKITFNDFSTWHIPVQPWSEDHACVRMSTVEKYVPEIIKWEAIVHGKDPERVLESTELPWDDTEPEWFDDFEHRKMNENTRQWFNDNADWLPYIDETIKSDSEEVDMELDKDDDWTDDW